MRTGSPPTSELLGALQALLDCGVLSDAEVADARRQVDEVEQELRSLQKWRRQRIGPPGSHALRPHELLELTLIPDRALADVDGVTIVIRAVEIWTSKLLLRIGALQSAFTDRLDAEHKAEMPAWLATRHDKDHTDRRRVPRQPGERLNDLPLGISDDVGTHYRSFNRSAGGSGTEWLAQWRFEPGVPPEATTLTIALEGDPADRQTVELPLPARA